MELSKSCQWCIVHKNHPIIQLAYPSWHPHCRRLLLFLHLEELWWQLVCLFQSQRLGFLWIFWLALAELWTTIPNYLGSRTVFNIGSVCVNATSSKLSSQTGKKRWPGSDELSSAESGIEGCSFEPCFIRTSSLAPSVIFTGLSIDSVDCLLTLHEIADGY